MIPTYEHFIVITKYPPLSAVTRTPYACELSIVYFYVHKSQPLIEIFFVLRFEIIETPATNPPLRASARMPYACVFPVIHTQTHKSKSLIKVFFIFGFEIIQAP